MRALILAAGRGRRMGAATGERPKGLVELAGRPLIAWQLDALRAAGAGDAAIVRGYRGEAFEPLDLGASFYDNPRWAETSMVASLACAEDWLVAGPCVVSYADLVYPPEAVRALVEADGDVALAYDTRWLELWRRRFDDPLEDAESFRVGADGRLLEIGGRAASVAEIGGQYMGLFRLTPAGAARLLERWRALPEAERDALDVTALFGRAVRDGEEIRTVPYDGWWCEVDSPSDLRVAAEIAARAGVT